MIQAVSVDTSPSSDGLTQGKPRRVKASPFMRLTRKGGLPHAGGMTTRRTHPCDF